MSAHMTVRPLRAWRVLRTGAYAAAVSLACTLAPAGLHAQADSTAANTIQLRPSLALGAGMLAFMGDIGRDHGAYSPLVSRVGYELRLSAPITPWLEGSLVALHGRLGVNERSLERNLNFESRITTGGLQFRYNFLHLLNPRRVVEPYLTFGFESVEFLTKTDLRDAQGRYYNYWSDGSIRDLPEDHPNAHQAEVIQRDHTYETDVRELNADGFGKYPERTWAVPLGAGARMDLGIGVDFRVGATMHFTMTDLMDGITPESIGDRKGNAGNDRFLYTHFSVGYTIPTGSRKPKKVFTPLPMDEMDLIVLEEDLDGDGVPDFRDRCLGTPPGVAVDANGCPLDGDSDAVPDHQDRELNSLPGAYVDAHGVTLSDADHLKAFLNWKDSANAVIVRSRVESFGPMPPPPFVEPKRKFVVKVGTHTEGVSEEIIQKILSLPDVRTIDSGDTTYYVVGNYETIPEALRREMELRGMGFNAETMGEEGGKLFDASRESEADRLRMRGMGAGDDSKDVIVRVQLGAFRYKLSKNIFADIDDLVTIKGEDGLTRYYTGMFRDVNEAARHKVRMLLAGFEGAFLVAFREGKRVSISEAGGVLTAPEDLRSLPSGSVNKALIRYKVQVGTYTGNVAMETMEALLEMGDISTVTGPDAVRYFYGTFKDRSSADDARRAIQGKGFADAFVVGEYNGRIIAAEEADRLMREP